MHAVWREIHLDSSSLRTSVRANWLRHRLTTGATWHPHSSIALTAISRACALFDRKPLWALHWRELHRPITMTQHWRCDYTTASYSLVESSTIEMMCIYCSFVRHFTFTCCVYIFFPRKYVPLRTLAYCKLLFQLYSSHYVWNVFPFTVPNFSW